MYSATKAYVSHLTRHLRTELVSKNIGVSMIEPGIVATELQEHVTFQGSRDWLTNAAKTIESCSRRTSRRSSASSPRSRSTSTCSRW